MDSILKFHCRLCKQQPYTTMFTKLDSYTTQVVGANCWSMAGWDRFDTCCIWDWGRLDKRSEDSGEDGSDRWPHKNWIEESDKIPESNYRRQFKLQAASKVHRLKDIHNTRSTGEDNARYWSSRSIQKEDNFADSNVDNAMSEALSVGMTERILSSVCRLSAIRRTSGFRIVSDEAVLVLAKTIPIDILAAEMRRIHLRRFEYPGQIPIIKAQERRTSMRKWQSREQFKGKVDISSCVWCNPLDEEQTLRAELLRDPVPNWPWILQEVPA